MRRQPSRKEGCEGVRAVWNPPHPSGTALRRLRTPLNGRPLTNGALADYLARLHADDLAPASLAMIVAGVRSAARLAGAQDPAGPMALRVLAGARRQGRIRGRGQARALDVTGLTMRDEGSGRPSISRSKTDQDGEGAVLYIGSPTVRRIRAWLEAAGAPTDGPLFWRLRRGETITGGCLCYVSLRKITRRHAEAIGLTGRITGHSLHVGSA